MKILKHVAGIVTDDKKRKKNKWKNIIYVYLNWKESGICSDLRLSQGER